MLELLVVIINYKTAQLVIDCLNTVIPQLSNEQKVVVVDNYSNDGSAEEISAWLDINPNDAVSLINSAVNSGFSGGNNIGMRSQKAKYYLLLNSDTLLRENALQQLVQTAKANPKAGIISPRLEWPSGEPQISCFRFHTPFSEMIASACSSPVTKLLYKWNVPIDIMPEVSEPDWASFACVLLRGQVVDDIGYMDEGYFLYYEDADYCQQLRQHGWGILNQPQAHVVHLRGGSSNVKSNKIKKSRVPKYYYASRTRYYRKHLGPVGHIMANIMWVLGRCISFARELLGKSGSISCEKQWQDIWTNTFRPLVPYKR